MKLQPPVKSEEHRAWEARVGHPVLSVRDLTDREIAALRVRIGSRDYGWCGRLNARIERWLDSFDWRRVARTIDGYAAAVVVIACVYFLYIVLAAWFLGAIQAVTR